MSSIVCLRWFSIKTAKELGAGNDTEAWYATQLVSWVLAGNFKVSLRLYGHIQTIPQKQLV